MIMFLLTNIPALVQAVDCPCDDTDLCQPVHVTHDKEVLGFMIRPQNWHHYNWSELTTIAIFTDLNDSSLNALMCHAHANQVRVIIHTGSEVLKLSNESTRSVYIANLLQRVKSHHLDGVNIDAEDPVAKGSDEELTLNVVTKEIYTAFKAVSPHYQVTSDVAWSPDCIDKRCYDYPELAKWTDFLVVMAYDERSQIFDSGLCLAGANSDYIKTQEGISLYLRLGIPPSKLVLGLPWYGYDYPCIEVMDERSPCEIPKYVFRGVNCSDGAGRQIGYADIMNDLYPKSTTNVIYNQTTESLFFTYKSDSGGYHQVWFDSPQSLSVKYSYAARMKLRGVAFWNTDTLDYDSSTSVAKQQIQEMWNAIQSFLGEQ